MKFGQLSLRTRILLVVALANSICALVALVGFTYFNRKELINGIENKQRTIHTQLGAATEFVARQGGLDDIIRKFRAKYNSPKQLSRDDKMEILNRVPIYAAMAIGKKNAEKDHYHFRVFASHPRNKDNQATPEELAILNRFDSNPDLSEQIINNGHTVTTYRPVKLSESQGCLTCHGNPSHSPWGDGHDILGYPMENWTDGQIHGVFAISQSIETVRASSHGGHLVTPAEWLMIAILLGSALAVLIGAYLVRRPLARLDEVASVLADSSGQVNTDAEQIARGAQALSEASVQQASALAETAASIEEMNSMVDRNSENARNTAQNSEQSRHTAEQGKAVVSQMMHSMEEIHQSNVRIMSQIDQSNREVSQIVEVIQQIGHKTQVINDIVFQTKLLSFNASVEAARAGEHGKGFAVVAQEIGNLARMSGSAAQEISAMLEESIRGVQSTVEKTKTEVENLIADGKKRVESGIDIAHQCETVLSDIVNNVVLVAQLAGEISTASQEQSVGVNELTKAMNLLDQATQRNTTTGAQSAESAERLATQAHSLRDAVMELVQTIHGERPITGDRQSLTTDQTRLEAA